MTAKACLKKSCLCILITGLVLVSINICDAQVLSAIPGIGNVDLGRVKVVPFVQVGYKNIGLNLNLPFNITPVDQFGNPMSAPPALDLMFRDTGVWVGSIGLDTRLSSDLFLTLRADGNTSKNISAVTGENYPWGGIQPPYTWGGSGFQWWDVDGMVGYMFYRQWSIVGGLRYDKLTVSLANPVDQTGTPINAPPQITQISQDISVKTWIPYAGLQLTGQNYRALLLYSPLASPQVLAPQSITATLPGFFTDSSLYNYKFANNGSFLDGYFEYNVPIRESLLFGLWARGTWMRFRGDGNWNFVNSFVPPPSSVVNPQSTTGTLSTYGLSGGISASLIF